MGKRKKANRQSKAKNTNSIRKGTGKRTEWPQRVAKGENMGTGNKLYPWLGKTTQKTGESWELKSK